MIYFKGFVKFDLMFKKSFVLNRTTKQRKEKKQSKKETKKCFRPKKINLFEFTLGNKNIRNSCLNLVI